LYFKQVYPSERSLTVYHKSLTPLQYPWVEKRRSLLLTSAGEYSIVLESGKPLADALIKFHDGRTAVLDEYLTASKLPTLFDRIPVVGIGSNASPLVTKSKIEKYGRYGTDATVPMFVAKMKNIGVGYSGHFVFGGYIPAAPYHHESNELEVTVAFFTKEQLAAVDSTEPTYQRAELSQELYPLAFENGDSLDSSYVYTTRYGVLQGADGTPIPLTTQEELYKLLNEAGVGDGFFEGEGITVSDRIAGKGRIGKSLVSAGVVFRDILVDDDIVAKSIAPELDIFEKYVKRSSTGYTRAYPYTRTGRYPAYSREDDVLESDDYLGWDEVSDTYSTSEYDNPYTPYRDDEDIWPGDEVDDSMFDPETGEFIEGVFDGMDVDPDYDEDYDQWWKHSTKSKRFAS
jgi:hypothetical protein